MREFDGRKDASAYPPQNMFFFAKLEYGIRRLMIHRHTRVSVGLAIPFIIFLLVNSRGWMIPTRSSSHFGGAQNVGYFSSLEGSLPPYHFVAVTDLDKFTPVKDSEKPLFESILLPGTLSRGEDGHYSIAFEPTRTLFSKFNEAGRGMELSELTLYDNRLLSFDDRTGCVFEILNDRHQNSSFVVPRFVITEGNGDFDKGMKLEWSAVKENELYMGSFGKEYSNLDGSIRSTNTLWIDILNRRGELRRLDWTREYNFVRGLLNATYPHGYVVHEAILWSKLHQTWVFVPRRVSTEPFNEEADERKGANVIVLVNPSFTDGKVVPIKNTGDIDPLHGFSSIAFVPNTQEKHVLAVRTVEENCLEMTTCQQRSYFMVLDLWTGDILMEEVEYHHATRDKIKFEGVEFVNLYL
mmetsp:Transcript_25940/g.39177  ORF Transcript_25940/g.39177 Transcript_25940/m.39177 type:complete len:410 (-) Transcript_25940:37-1266(-)